MSNVEQFEKAVADAGAVAMRIMRRPDGSERLVIQTLAQRIHDASLRDRAEDGKVYPWRVGA